MFYEIEICTVLSAIVQLPTAAEPQLYILCTFKIVPQEKNIHLFESEIGVGSVTFELQTVVRNIYLNATLVYSFQIACSNSSIKQ